MIQGTLHPQNLVHGCGDVFGTRVYKVLESSEGLLQQVEVELVNSLSAFHLLINAHLEVTLPEAAWWSRSTLRTQSPRLQWSLDLH